MGRKRKGRAGEQAVRTAFTRKLLAWWARAARDLPWRNTRDPYRVLVSEFMLQQTQVSRVAEYYPRFIERFPDLATLANAKPRAVREAWDGLGYYARASNLHALAKSVVGRGVVESGVAEKGVAGDGVATLPMIPKSSSSYLASDGILLARWLASPLKSPFRPSTQTYVAYC